MGAGAGLCVCVWVGVCVCVCVCVGCVRGRWIVCVCVYIFDKFGPDQNLKLNKSFEGIRVECVCVCVDLLVGGVVS